MRKLRCMNIDESDVQRALDHFSKRMETYDIKEADVVSVNIKDGEPREQFDPVIGQKRMLPSYKVSIMHWTSN